MRHDWLIGSSPETCWSFTKHKMIAKNNCSSPYLDSFCTIGISATILIPIYWGRIFLILLTDIVYGIVGSYVITYARNVTSPPHEPPRVQCVSTFSLLIPTLAFSLSQRFYSHLTIRLLEWYCLTSRDLWLEYWNKFRTWGHSRTSWDAPGQILSIRGNLKLCLLFIVHMIFSCQKHI